jgi:hypothetical protein
MIIGIYATLGVFLLIAARNPLAHRSLIWFTVVSSVVHAAIMSLQAVVDPAERGHLWGDVGSRKATLATNPPYRMCLRRRRSGASLHAEAWWRATVALVQ